MIIGIDFDGTCCHHRNHEVGPAVLGAVSVMKKLLGHGHELVLWTCRIGKDLDEAVQWFTEEGIILSGVNCNSPNVPYVHLSAKIYCHLYIDDRALGVPLRKDPREDREHVDWYACHDLLFEQGAFATKNIGIV